LFKNTTLKKKVILTLATMVRKVFSGWHITAGAVCLCAHATTLSAEDSGFQIESAKTVLQDDVYHITMRLDYRFSPEVLEAIRSGVPMVLVMDIELFRTRKYWWDKEIAELQQRFQLQYHALAEQYIVRNLNSGAQYTAPTLNTALYYMQDVENLPLIDQQLLESNEQYRVRARVSLEFDALPAPLKFSAYTSRDWWLGSQWYEWSLE
jgi:hypothetical protein